MQPFLWVRRPLCLILLATQLLTACTSWRVESTPLPDRLRADPPSSVRLWLRDSTRLEIRDPRWVSDSVAGTGERKQPIAIPAADITGYATRHFSAGKTIGLVGAVIGGFFLFAIIVCETDGCGGNIGY